ncbi:MAG: ACP S-malonyltransferase [Opitutales bacterium]|nr:ACP S-malonyltransferase [Opitutales bacterium]
MTTALWFSGQGAQSVGMAKSLHEADADVRELFARADETLDMPLSKFCFEGPMEELTKTSVCQPALFLHGICVMTILKKRGLLEGLAAASGLSLGELTAHAAAGTYSFEDGLKIVAERGRLMQEACDASKGAMACFIGGTVDDVKPYCEEFDVDMANLNCPGQVVISGEAEKIEAASAAAKERKAFKMVVPLKVAGAYHSRLMEPARAKFEKFLENIEFKTPKLAVFTNVTGEQISDPAEIKKALVKQVVSPVKWELCVRNAAKLGIEQYYECGPGGVLTGLAKRIDKALNAKAIAEIADFE